MKADSPPRRIWIVGPSGSGKSYTADMLAARAGVPAVHLDDIHWNPGWVESTDDEMRPRVEAATSGPGWVVDGNYTRIAGDLRERADLVLWLDLPFRVTFLRVVSRTFGRLARRETCCNGNRESLRETLLSPQSVLWWAITTHLRTRRRLGAELASKPHVRLRSPREVAEFLARATAT
jgi:adenylate kinase family enzyme